ncbi:MAG: hypothetical protein LH618_15415 [Saprospiraceae bacterium]|nr:hypothetical protein [Saprospiraceae bacterium]
MQRIIFLALMIVTTFQAMAQAQPEAKAADRIRAYRVAVYTEVLQLTAEEAQSFWPIFNEYAASREKLQQQMRPDRQLDAMSDAEVEEYVRKYFDVRQQEMNLEKDLATRLRKVLPIRKIAKLPAAEREFREGLVRKLQALRERKVERQNLRRGNR